ncbi:LysR family transcriptional regulator [Paenibacillus filicis]|uniref:LysR family transcriptional regulator n=1 Tax=Paenibacillus filicis TaxID=669464 RepID=A0ABU9DJY3_9BACL
MNLNLLKLQMIELLEKHQKITAVADELGLKQPTITFHMKNLEQELGVQLFESRSGKTLLTDAGRSLHHYAVKINALALEAERVVREFDELGRGVLRVGASYVPGTYMLPRVMTEFSRVYPRISLQLEVKTAPVIKQLLLDHEIDIGVLSTEPFQLASLVSEALCEDELVVIFSPQHRFASLPELEPSHLAETPFLLHGLASSTRQMTDRWAQSHGVHLYAQMELDSLEAIKQVVMLGDCVSFVSRQAVRKEAERGELQYRPIPANTFRRDICCAFNADRKHSAVLDQFIVHLRKEASSLHEGIRTGEAG